MMTLLLGFTSAWLVFWGVLLGMLATRDRMRSAQPLTLLDHARFEA